MAREPGIAFVVEYACPHCRAALRDRSEAPGRWLRCPACGRAGRAPAEMAPEASDVSRRPGPRQDIIFLDDPPGVNGNRKMTGPAPIRFGVEARRPGSGKQVASAATLFVSVCLLMFALLDGNAYVAALLLGLAIVSLVLLIRFSR